MEPAAILTLSLGELGWSCSTIESGRQQGMAYQKESLKPIGHPVPSGCWLSWMLTEGGLPFGNEYAVEKDSSQQVRDSLTKLGREALSRLVQSGWTLRDEWPKPTSSAVQDWLGRRFYFAHSRTFSESSRYSSIVSSQLGRHRLRLPHWPQLLDWALRTLHRDHSVLLSVPGITLDTPAVHFAKVCDIPTVRICFAKVVAGDQKQVSNWLAELLRSNVTCSESRLRPDTVYVSPAWGSDETTGGLGRYPIQDRASIALADRVLAVSVRSSGNIAGLLGQRLQDDRFPCGTVFLAAENDRRESEEKKSPSRGTFSKLLPWLDQGAVGWVVLHQPTTGLRELSRCHFQCFADRALRGEQSKREQPKERSPTVVQLSAPAARTWQNQSAGWPYLAHCTRGVNGPLPQETQAAYYDRLWQTGREIPREPFWTLIRILREQRLHGTTWMTRGNLPSVSLSEVPLQELLNRRQFRSHLGRWDWEPYGVLIRKEYLEQARQVIYGRQSDYERLALQDRVYFQPADSKYDWSQEREWRVLGDLDLRPLPTHAVTVFVRSRLEAVQLARESRFPVI